MGVRLTIGSWTIHQADFSVTEDSTPLDAGDSSGSVGSFTITLAEPDGALFDESTPANSAMAQVARFGEGILIRKPVEIAVTGKGVMLGRVESAQRGGQGTIVLTCSSRLNRLNTYNVNAKPYVGTLCGLFTYYLSLARITSDFYIDPSIADRPIVAPGWSGEMWFHLKQLMVAEQVEIALVDGIYTLRRTHTNYLEKDREITRSSDMPIPTLAQAVEVYNYQSRAITNELVYPPKGWTIETEVLNVNAGEEQEYPLELSSSVGSIQTPTMVTSVAPDFDSASVYTIVANDGLPVPPAMWADKGGRLTVTINEDTTSLTVKLVGAKGVPTSSGEVATNFSVALASDETGNRYSTLRIVGTGVAFDKKKLTISTGIPETRTATEVGVTIDNPFIRDIDQAYTAGIRGAAQFSSPIPSLSATVVATHPNNSSAFGMVAGGRVWDRRSARWYRVRSATHTYGDVQVSAEDDTTVGDFVEMWGDADLESFVAEQGHLTMEEANLIGLRR